MFSISASFAKNCITHREKEIIHLRVSNHCHYTAGYSAGYVIKSLTPHREINTPRRRNAKLAIEGSCEKWVKRCSTIASAGVKGTKQRGPLWINGSTVRYLHVPLIHSRRGAAPARAEKPTFPPQGTFKSFLYIGAAAHTSGWVSFDAALLFLIPMMITGVKFRSNSYFIKGWLK